MILVGFGLPFAPLSAQNLTDVADPIVPSGHSYIIGWGVDGSGERLFLLTTAEVWRSPFYPGATIWTKIADPSLVNVRMDETSLALLHLARSPAAARWRSHSC